MRLGWKFVFAAMMFPAFIHAITVSGTVCGDNECLSTLSGVLVKLYNGSSISDTVLQDDTTTNTSGFYTLNWGTNGQKIFVINQPGYNNYVAAVTFNNGGPYTVNMTLAINNNTSTITGTVVATSNSVPIDGATVTLSGGVLGEPISVHTNSLGQYTFDSVGTGTGYSVSASKLGYNGSSAGNVAAVWNATTNITSLSLTNNKGRITGTISNSATGNPVIKTGNAIMFFAPSINDSLVRIDSVGTDTFGYYSDSLPSATYTVKIGSAGYKSDSDLTYLDTSNTVITGTTTTLNAFLTTATASLGGTVDVDNISASGVKIYLQRRATNVGMSDSVFWTVDSTTTNANGLYVFSNLISGLQANYRIHVLDLGYMLDINSSNTDVPAGTAVTLNFNSTTAIQPLSPLQSSFSLHQSPSFLSFTLPTNFSNYSSTAAIYNLSGNRLIESPISKSNFSIPISNLLDGKYFLKIEDSKNQIVNPFEIDR